MKREFRPSQPTPESKETIKKHWEHKCNACEAKGSTSFTENGKLQKMDVYSCSNHSQPSYHGAPDLKIDGDIYVVRYGETTNMSIGEISINEGDVDLDKLRAIAKNRGGSSRPTTAQIALGKVL